MAATQNLTPLQRQLAVVQVAKATSLLQLAVVAVEQPLIAR
jgi:hypothetical protein